MCSHGIGLRSRSIFRAGATFGCRHAWSLFCQTEIKRNLEPLTCTGKSQSIHKYIYIIIITKTRNERSMQCLYIYMMLQMHACCAAFRNPHASMRWQCHSRMGNMPHADATAADIVQHSNQCCRLCSHYIHLKKQHSNQRMH